MIICAKRRMADPPGNLLNQLRLFELALPCCLRHAVLRHRKLGVRVRAVVGCAIDVGEEPPIPTSLCSHIGRIGVGRHPHYVVFGHAFDDREQHVVNAGMLALGVGLRLDRTFAY